jgi:hypothetical protein
MRDMVGGSYPLALSSTFIPELLSMNLLMAGMVLTAMILKMRVLSADDPVAPAFWFVMSMALLVGFVIAYPMNWWLVANHLKHGMMTVRPTSAAVGADFGHLGMDPAAATDRAMRMPNEKAAEKTAEKTAPWPPVPVMTVLSFLALAAGIAIAFQP